MFRDPRVLEAGDRAHLVTQLRAAVELRPEIAELRVLLGMALCVDLQAQQAMEGFASRWSKRRIPSSPG